MTLVATEASYGLLNQELRQRRPSRYEVRLLSRRERRFAILRRP